MKRKIRLTLATLLATLVLFSASSGVVYAGDESDTMASYAVPAQLDCVITTGDWTLNDITGNGKILHDTIYYSNPLGDTTAPSATVLATECFVNLDLSGTNVITNLFCTVGDYTGGDAMVNSDTGSNGVGEFGAYAWYEGMTYANKVVAKSSGSDVLKASHPAATDLKCGMDITGQSDAFVSETQMENVITFYLVMV